MEKGYFYAPYIPQVKMSRRVLKMFEPKKSYYIIAIDNENKEVFNIEVESICNGVDEVISKVTYNFSKKTVKLLWYYLSDGKNILAVSKYSILLTFNDCIDISWHHPAIERDKDGNGYFVKPLNIDHGINNTYIAKADTLVPKCMVNFRPVFVLLDVPYWDTNGPFGNEHGGWNLIEGDKIIGHVRKEGDMYRAYSLESLHAHQTLETTMLHYSIFAAKLYIEAHHGLKDVLCACNKFWESEYGKKFNTLF